MLLLNKNILSGAAQQCAVQVKISFSKIQNIFTEMGQEGKKELSLNTAKNLALL